MYGTVTMCSRAVRGVVISLHVPVHYICKTAVRSKFATYPIKTCSFTVREKLCCPTPDAWALDATSAPDSMRGSNSSVEKPGPIELFLKHIASAYEGRRITRRKICDADTTELSGLTARSDQNRSKCSQQDF
jgi:hypothetical protein